MSLKSGAGNLDEYKYGGDSFKRETSPVGSMPPSRLGSVDAEPGRNDFESTSPIAEPNSTSITDDDTALEALLTSSINQDTSNEGIASQVVMADAA